jgi:hypothetical protein
MAGGDRGPKVRLSHKSDASHKIQVTRGTVASEKDNQMSETMIKTEICRILTYLNPFSILAHATTQHLVITLYLKPWVNLLS